MSYEKKSTTLEDVIAEFEAKDGMADCAMLLTELSRNATRQQILDHELVSQGAIWRNLLFMETEQVGEASDALRELLRADNDEGKRAAAKKFAEILNI